MIRFFTISFIAIIFFLAGLSVRPLTNSCGVLVKGEINELQKEQITGFINSYFDSWNSRDWKKYKQHFSSNSMIFFSRDGKLFGIGLELFLAGQISSVKSTRLPIYETAEEIIIEANAESASVAVNWKLSNIKSTSRGVDRFTLLFDATSNTWKIVSLFYTRI